MDFRTVLNNNVKNVLGWKTKRKFVVLAIDDYGNVRLDSKKARNNLELDRIKRVTHFDLFDALETKEDLEILFETLLSVKDLHGKPAVVTPFSLPCNIDFEKTISGNYTNFEYESLTQTFLKKEAHDPIAYHGAWKIWKQGISEGIFIPQFHGREHINLKVFKSQLFRKDQFLLKCLNNRSYTGIINTDFPTISYTAAFDFWDRDENLGFLEIIKDGILRFKEEFGYTPNHFNAPGSSASSIIEEYLFENGITHIDNPFLKREHLGKGKFKLTMNYTGKKLKSGLYNINRNVVFEPLVCKNRDWTSYTISQIEAAFSWQKPAIISSHRVNFCGHIDIENRKYGIQELSKLLKAITKKWPDVEFISSRDLIENMRNN